MSRKQKIVIAIIVIILCIVIVSICLFKSDKNSEKIVVCNEINENIILENDINTENIVEEDETKQDNIVEENEETQVVETTPSSNPQAIYESDTDVGSTDKKQEAIDLVKETWGEDDTVTFRCDSVTNDGEYIIAVISTQTASVKNYFIVNLENKTVTVDY